MQRHDDDLRACDFGSEPSDGLGWFCMLVVLISPIIIVGIITGWTWP